MVENLKFIILDNSCRENYLQVEEKVNNVSKKYEKLSLIFIFAKKKN